MSHPTLSVTITNYNYARFLARAIESVLAQSFTDYELILIDNASTDESVEVMRSYAATDDRVRIIAHNENQGALASLRESCDAARGRYRVQVDADDWVLSPDAFALQTSMLDANPAMSFVYSNMVLVGADERVIHVSRPFDGDQVLDGAAAVEAVLSFTLTHSGMMVRLSAYHEAGGYPAGLPHNDDMLLAARLCALGDVGYLDRRLYAFRQHGANVHLRPQLNVVADEILPVIDEVFRGPLGTRVPDAARVRRRVERNALVHMPTQYIFGGRPRDGWRLYLASLRARPLTTLIQPRTASLVARTVLGDAGYRRVRGLLRPRAAATSSAETRSPA